MIEFDEDALRHDLETCTAQQLLAISTASAQRTLDVVEPHTDRLGVKTVETLAGIVDALWRSLSSTNIVTQKERQLAEDLVPHDEDDDWTPASAYLQNAAAAAAFAVDVALEGATRDAFWSVFQVYELADYEVLRHRLDIDLNTVQGRKDFAASEVVQLALSSIQADVRAVTKGISPADLRARVREDSVHWASLFPG